jgi:hypothetical protein
VVLMRSASWTYRDCQGYTAIAVTTLARPDAEVRLAGEF